MSAINAFSLMNSKRREFDANDPATWIVRAQNVIKQIEELEHEAHAAGLIVTAHRLNEAKNKAGWELAEFMELQEKPKRQRQT